MQTGEQPDDPYFNDGDVIVTTYDQLLSGLLCGPYGLSPMQYNVNAGCVAGNLVVFDEFHLMETSRAFLSGIVCLSMFGEITRSVWMTATATGAATDELRHQLGALSVELSDAEQQALYSGMGIRRVLRKHDHVLTARDVLDGASGPTLVVVNQVKRAQSLYHDVMNFAGERGFPCDRIRLIHGRFFQRDRDIKQQFLSEYFAKQRNGPAIVIATQVVEAGLDLSAAGLLTEVCPMNALVQRAGRCARFKDQQGTVHVFPLDWDEKNVCRPYEAGVVTETWSVLEDTDDFSPQRAAEWIQTVHGAGDAREIGASRDEVRRKCVSSIINSVHHTRLGGISELIRGDSDSVRALILNDPCGTLPSSRESIAVSRDGLYSSASTGAMWVFDADEPRLWRVAQKDDIGYAYVVALSPAIARYTESFGLELGVPGEINSPVRDRITPRISGKLGRESWAKHTLGVDGDTHRRMTDEIVPGGLLGTATSDVLRRCVEAATLAHDLGKLQNGWQLWAEAYERDKDPTYQHVEALAHTNFDAEDRNDRERSWRVRPRRPPHAAASAWYAHALGWVRFQGLSPDENRIVMAAVLSHHGGWWADNTDIQPPHSLSKAALAAIGINAHTLRPPSPSEGIRFKRELDKVADDSFEVRWPLMALTVRILRLSDRRATEEGRPSE
jgi:CRISPR-associated endonuclease/helicase Cas3